MRDYYSSLLVTVATSLLTLGVFQPFALGNPQTQDSNSKQIEVRLIPKIKTIKVGGTLEVRVEIQNVGANQLFIEQVIYSPWCGPSPLSLRLELGPPMKPQHDAQACAADCMHDAKESFARRLVERWTSLPAGHLYGSVVVMYPEEFQQLKTPGRWRLRGTYQSLGDLSSSFCGYFGPKPDDTEDIKGLTYKAWQGKVDTNTVWIEVVPVGSSSKVKKSL